MTDPRKAIFAAVKAAKPDVFNDPTDGARRIGALDSVLDALGIPRAGQVAKAKPAPAPAPAARKVSAAGIQLLHSFEGCEKDRPDGRFEAYPDPGSNDGHPWTIGWGSTGPDHFNGGRIQKGTIWTKAQCDARFEQDIAKYAADVLGALGDAINRTTQAQFDALVSFHYNTGAIAKATLTRKHVAGDYAGAATEFARWVRNDGAVMKGLVRRRAAEAAMYRGDA
jgi:lysozyme